MSQIVRSNPEHPDGVGRDLTASDESRDSDSLEPPTLTRGQTEPLAALVAVAAFCVAVSMYTGLHTNLLSDAGSERQLGEATADRIWADISDNGVYYGPSLDVDPATLPSGYYVSVNVTYVGENGRVQSLDRATYDRSGTRLADQHTPPPEAERYDRSISIRKEPGNVRPGTLEVVVWE